jgi:iron transport multicopper oxidase
MYVETTLIFTIHANDMFQLRLYSALAFLLLATDAIAATVSYNWDVTWVTASPDGFERPVVGINGAWPCPSIEANVGDTIVLTVNNQLGNETTGIHFHGINQVNTSWMDGANGVAQCSVPPGSSITYDFVVCRTFDFQMLSSRTN